MKLNIMAEEEINTRFECGMEVSIRVRRLDYLNSVMNCRKDMGFSLVEAIGVQTV